MSRGFESMRGFDLFMKVAQQIYRQFPDVVFVVVGSTRVCYGGDEKHIQHNTFFEHVLAQSDYDLSKFIFTGLVPVTTLVDLLSLSDLHLYWTVPFVLSWSLMDALSCGCTVLASDTAPVREMIDDGRNGRLCGFYDVDGFATRAVEILRDPEAFRHLGRPPRPVFAATTRSTSRFPVSRGCLSRQSTKWPRVNSAGRGRRGVELGLHHSCILSEFVCRDSAQARPLSSPPCEGGAGVGR